MSWELRHLTYMTSILTVALMGYFAFTSSAAATAMAPIIAETTNTSEKVAVQDEHIAREVVSYTVHVTAYNAVPEQTDSNPFVTASGAPSNPEIVAARSRDLAEELPFGTVIAFEYSGQNDPSCGFTAVEHLIGYRVIADTMNARMTNKVDLLFDQTDTVRHGGVERNPSKVFGVCGDVTIRVVGHLDIDEIPATQAELAELFDGAALARI
jgi:3D (Asp-Asp-Asp) domain-containing protein